MQKKDVFDEIVQGIRADYAPLYECSCAQLSRALPFRADFTNRIHATIIDLYADSYSPGNSQASPLVYIANHPGGLLFDFILLNKLVHAGFKTIQVIAIEPLYPTQPAIAKAVQAFANWFKELHDWHPAHPNITLTLFPSWQAYVAACIQHTSPRGDIVLTIDPGVAKIPQLPPSSAGLNAFYARASATLANQFIWFELAHKTAPQETWRFEKICWVLQGPTQPNKPLLIMHESAGQEALTTKHARAWFGKTEILADQPISAYPLGIGTKRLSQEQIIQNAPLKELTNMLCNKENPTHEKLRAIHEALAK
jgi:hypothetical protein